MRACLFLLCLLVSSLSSPFNCYAQEADDSLVVRLTTESSLLPLYLVPFTNDQAHFPDSYLKQLEQVLAFDLGHNGSTSLVKNTSANNRLATAGSFEQFGSMQDWKQQNIFYVIKAKVQGNKLSAAMLSVSNQSVKSAEAIPLTGQLEQDRHQIHKLADTIYKALFGKDGIASTKILYTVRKPAKTPEGWISEVWEMDYDGANARQLTHDQHYCTTPTYIPPKAGYTTGGFLYSSYKLGQPRIYIASLKDGIGHRLLFLKGSQMMPAVSRQRDQLAFISDIENNPDLFVQDFSPEEGPIGKPRQIFSAKHATQSSPTFSPDGKKIAFVSDKDGSPRIYVINVPPTGTRLKAIEAKLISKQNRESSAPCWSPDGTKIAYCARTQGERQIWIYDFTTNQERQLTQGPGHKENPSWASNSLHLVFNSADADANELYFINLNQPEATQISSGFGDKRFPCWEPRIRN